MIEIGAVYPCRKRPPEYLRKTISPGWREKFGRVTEAGTGDQTIMGKII